MINKTNIEHKKNTLFSKSALIVLIRVFILQSHQIENP